MDASSQTAASKPDGVPSGPAPLVPGRKLTISCWLIISLAKFGRIESLTRTTEFSILSQ